MNLLKPTSSSDTYSRPCPTAKKLICFCGGKTIPSGFHTIKRSTRIAHFRSPRLSNANHSIHCPRLTSKVGRRTLVMVAPEAAATRMTLLNLMGFVGFVPFEENVLSGPFIGPSRKALRYHELETQFIAS